MVTYLNKKVIIIGGIYVNISQVRYKCYYSFFYNELFVNLKYKSSYQMFDEQLMFGE